MLPIQAPTQPETPTAPVVAGARTAATSASAIYEGLRAQQRELRGQLAELDGTRSNISNQLEETSSGSQAQKALETRMADVDARIAKVDNMIAANETQLAQAAAIPGAVIERPPPIERGPPEEAYVLGGLFMILVFFPLSVALARRIWKRSAAAVASLPRDIGERLARMEQALEAAAVEVERIGEGQRFLTRLFTEGEGARSISAGAALPVERKPINAPKPLP